MKTRGLRGVIPCLLFFALTGATVRGQCPEEPPLQHYTGGGNVVCPCFVEGEHAGAIFELSPSEYPIEILRVGIGWGSQFGGSGDSLQDSINIYAGGLPDPGAPQYSLDGPQLTDGFINEFDLEPTAGNKIINSGPFTVTLRFLESNAGNPFAPSVVHDGNGCQLGKNIVFDKAQDKWVDGCSLGIGGDWVFFVVYRKVDCGGGSGPGSVPDGKEVPGTPMLARREANNDVTLEWSPSCSATDDDYEIYAGTIGSYPSHFSKFCSTGGATTFTFTPNSGNRYYIVVPTDGTEEGSYGRDGGGDERPTGGGACRPRPALLACP